MSKINKHETNVNDSSHAVHANQLNVSDSDTTTAAAETVNTENENAETRETTAERKRPAQYENVNQFVYIGAALPGGVLKSNAVLIGTYEQITEYYKAVIEEYPAVARLIVPVTRLADSREKSRKSGNLINKHYQEVADAIKTKTRKGEEE